MAHKHLHKHSNGPRQKLPINTIPVAPDQNWISESESLKAPEVKASAPEEAKSPLDKAEQSFEWILGEVNKYLKTSKDYLSEKPLETVAVAATAGLAAWAAMYTAKSRKKPAVRAASTNLKKSVKKAKKISVRKGQARKAKKA